MALRRQSWSVYNNPATKIKLFAGNWDKCSEYQPQALYLPNFSIKMPNKFISAGVWLKPALPI
jgi:hypothetical protein